MQNIIVYGASGHAKAVIDTVEKMGLYRIAGLLDDNKPSGTNIYGYEVLGDRGWLAANLDSISGGIVAIGDSWLRSRVAAKISDIHPSFAFITAIHPAASIARGAQIGAGSVIMAGSVVNSDTTIGEHCVLYSQATVDHDSSLGSFVTLAPKAGTGGGVSIGDYSVISIGANIIHGKTIGEHTVIGAGSTVLTDIPSYQVAYGTPAKVIRAREKGERYL
jgi:sugar O-acyltransferase (sialic acid O-acetyltransferase NeuD family)